MKDKRRVYDKYANHGYAALILKQLRPNIGALLNAIEANLTVHETIDVHEWIGNWFYIVIEDKRYTEYPLDAQCGFTVNITKDAVMWNDDKSENQFGGNCFLRSRRWKKFVNAYWNGAVTEKQMRFYNVVPLPKPVDSYMDVAIYESTSPWPKGFCVDRHTRDERVNDRTKRQTYSTVSVAKEAIRGSLMEYHQIQASYHENALAKLGTYAEAPPA